MDQPKILIIDDEKAICTACSQVLKEAGYKVETSLEGRSGLKKIDDFNPDIVFVDLKMPGINGMEVLEKIKERDPDIISIVITGYGTIESAVESMKKGAYDFLPKPFTPDQLRIIARRAFDKRMTSLQAERLRQEKEKMKQNFISMVSHELRTPLVAVMQYLEVLANGFAGSVTSEQAKIIERIKIRVRELLKLIDRWLKLSRLEELKFKEGFTEVSLSLVIKEVIDLVKHFAEEKNVTIELSPITSSAIINGDPEMIKEVFINLINNGIKYNREGGRVVLQLKEEEDFWVIDVSDTGIGIAAHEIPHIGEEFYCIKREGSAAGIGIGLAIVKKILDIHGGKLEINSKLNYGSTFSVFLPKIGSQPKEII